MFRTCKLRTETDKLASFESVTEAVAKNAIEIACSVDRSVLQDETGAIFCTAAAASQSAVRPTVIPLLTSHIL